MKNPLIKNLEYTRKIVGNKWKLHIFFYLVSGPKRFGELLYHIPGITQHTLSNNLQSLQEDGIIKKKIYAEVPPRTEYVLTEIGQQFLPVLQAMANWGAYYQETMNHENSEI